MKNKSILLILITSFSMGMIVFINLELLASPTSILIPTLISDHQETTRRGSIYYTDAKPTDNTVHIAWTESTTTTFPYDTDLFYRQLPNGSTINLSKGVQTLGNAGPVMVQVGTGNDVCVLWREATPSGDYYLFLWRSATNTTSISPSSVGVDSTLTYAQFTCNPAQNAKIAWVDSTDEVYLWDEASDSQTKLSNDDTGDIRHFQRVDVNNVIYLSWNEPESNVYHVYLWDSVSETTQQLAPNGGQPQLLKDKNDTIHLIWEWPNIIGPICHYYWNSQTQTSDLLMECNDFELAVVNDGVGNVHATWHKNSGVTPIHYWNMTENITDTAEMPNQAVIKMNLIGGPDNKAHLFWQDNSSRDFYYWNSNTLSETFITPASYYLQENLTWDFDSNGTIHTLWDDSLISPNSTDVSYWTPSFSSPITLTESPLFFPLIDLVMDDQDTAHAVYSGQPGTLVHYWNTQTNQVQVVSTQGVLVNSSINLVADLNNEVFAFYPSTPDSHYYWSSVSGEFYLGRGGQVTPILDKMNKLHVYWIASEDMNLEGEDMYAAWIPNNHDHFVYLPNILR